MGRRQVLGVRCRPAVLEAAHVRGAALALVEDLDRRRREPDLDVVGRALVGHRVIVMIGRHVVVEPDLRLRPVTVNETVGRQRGVRGAIEIVEELAPRLAVSLHHPVVQVGHEPSNVLVYLVDRETGDVA